VKWRIPSSDAALSSLLGPTSILLSFFLSFYTKHRCSFSSFHINSSLITTEATILRTSPYLSCSFFFFFFDITFFFFFHFFLSENSCNILSFLLFFIEKKKSNQPFSETQKKNTALTDNKTRTLSLIIFFLIPFFFICIRKKRLNIVDF